MTETQSSYRHIIKVTSLFGGVQVFGIFIIIIRTKFVAVLLGPGGMGIAGLLESTLGFVGAITDFGLKTSAVRNIASAKSFGNQKKISDVVNVLRKLVWLTGLLGTVITIIISPWLSKIAFGNEDYTLAFIYIAVSLLIRQLGAGQGVILQGMRRLKYLAKANLTGSILGLLFTVPLYYFFGIDGIVPGIILTAVLSTGTVWFYSKKIKIEPVRVSFKRAIIEGKDMASMGFMISLSGLLTLGAAYLLRIFISNIGGVEQVGLYNAGFAVINTYTGLIFSAMATDYYPRLSEVASDNRKVKDLINQQAEIAVLILAPILILFLIFVNWIIIMLYSDKFIPINNMILWAALGMFFKSASWSVSYAFLAKGDKKLFFWSELLANSYLLGLNIAGYYLFGLTGLGISFLIAFSAYLIQVYIITKFKYNFSFNRQFYSIYIIQFILSVFCFLLAMYLTGIYLYAFGSVLLIFSSVYSLKELDKRLDFKSLWISFKKKFSKKSFDDGEQ